MSKHVDIATLNDRTELLRLIAEAQFGNTVIFREGAEDRGVLMSSSAFRFVQKAIGLVWNEMPVTCWEDPLIVACAEASIPPAH